MNLKFDTLAPNQSDPLSRPDGGEYTTLPDVFSVTRPK